MSIHGKAVPESTFSAEQVAKINHLLGVVYGVFEAANIGPDSDQLLKKGAGSSIDIDRAVGAENIREDL